MGNITPSMDGGGLPMGDAKLDWVKQLDAISSMERFKIYAEVCKKRVMEEAIGLLIMAYKWEEHAHKHWEIAMESNLGHGNDLFSMDKEKPGSIEELRKFIVAWLENNGKSLDDFIDYEEPF